MQTFTQQSEHKAVNKFTKLTKNDISRSSEDESDGRYMKEKESSEGERHITFINRHFYYIFANKHTFYACFPALSLSATVTEVLDSKIRSLRNSFELGDGDEVPTTQITHDPSSSPAKHTQDNNNTLKPLSLGENIPYVDESPERPLIQARVKPMRHSNNNNTHSSDVKLDKSKLDESSDTDSSTTSNHNHHHDRLKSVMRLEDSVLRKVNR